MNRNTSVRLTIASSVAAVLLLIGVAGEQANHVSARRDTLADVVPIAQPKPIAVECAIGAVDPSVSEDDDAAKVRKATTDWVKDKYPDAKIEGVFMLAFAKGNLYLAGADTQFGEGKRRTVDVLVRRYTKRNGGQYFRAEGMEPEQAAAMRQKADFDADATEDATAPDNATAPDSDDAK